MGIYSEYLDRNFDFLALSAERKVQLRRVADIRQRDILVFAADLKKAGQAQIQISFPDILPVRDQLSNLTGRAIDVILETPGGYAEYAEQIVRIIRGRYPSVAIIVPGAAMSAGTIMAMSADEILMDETSVLGPIDAQIIQQGKVFSADALLKGFEKIKDEVQRTGALNKAYIPMLQAISPGELEAAGNALALAKQLVEDWLVAYKFQEWNVHTSNGAAVTDEEKRIRAGEIAGELCEHGKWRSHGRGIMLADLETMRLKITDFGEQADLADAIRRYYTLLQMTFDRTPIYKVYETPTSQIYKSVTPLGGGAAPGGVGDVEIECSCGEKLQIQANLGRPQPLKPGRIAFPGNNQLKCPKCDTTHDLKALRDQVEKQSGQKIV